MATDSAETLKRRGDELIAMFDTSRIKHTFGMVLSYDDTGRAHFDLPYNAAFDHALGGIHGGVYATMLDNAGWFTVAARYETWVATVDFSMKLLGAVTADALHAVGRVLRSGKRLAMAEMELRNSAGEIVAVGQATFSITSLPRDSKGVERFSST